MSTPNRIWNLHSVIKGIENQATTLIKSHSREKENENVHLDSTIANNPLLPPEYQKLNMNLWVHRNQLPNLHPNPTLWVM